MSDYRIAAMPPQVPAALIESLSRVETATIGHTRQWGFMDRTIQPLLRGRRIAGTAVTLASPGLDSTLLHHALGLLRPGDVLVLDRLGDDRYACWGGGVTIAAQVAGAVGAILDGPCTDRSEIESMGFPLWCRGVSAVTARHCNLGGTLNLPVTCGNVPVSAGDVILADESGVVVLTAAEAQAVAEAALARQDRGLITEARLRGGEKLGDINGATSLVLAALASRE